MNVSPSTNTSSLYASESAESKRAQLQALILKRSVELLQDQSDQVKKEVEGKGQIIDILV